MSNVEKLDDSNLDNIAGGQLALEDVMGVKGLWFCTGAPTDKVPDGVFWQYKGLYITKKQAFNIMVNQGTQDIYEWIDNIRQKGDPFDQPSVDFFSDYVEKYNKKAYGEIIR